MPSTQRRPIYASGKWDVDLSRRELRARGKPVPIGGRAFEIVEVLVKSAGQLVSKDELIDRVWKGLEENALPRIRSIWTQNTRHFEALDQTF
jgi:DNA-binding winged helix-turn-helix (wHTH) protein